METRVWYPSFDLTLLRGDDNDLMFESKDKIILCDGNYYRAKFVREFHFDEEDKEHFCLEDWVCYDDKRNSDMWFNLVKWKVDTYINLPFESKYWIDVEQELPPKNINEAEEGGTQVLVKMERDGVTKIIVAFCHYDMDEDDECSCWWHTWEEEEENGEDLDLSCNSDKQNFNKIKDLLREPNKAWIITHWMPIDKVMDESHKPIKTYNYEKEDISK